MYISAPNTTATDYAREVNPGPTSLSLGLLRRQNACTALLREWPFSFICTASSLCLATAVATGLQHFAYAHHIVALRRPDHWRVVKHLGEVGAAPVRLVPLGCQYTNLHRNR